jgi:DNA invertase Pin-like site-specific DNA recombinase
MQDRIVSYLRVSTDKQGQSGLGLEAQRSYVKAYCARTAATVLREYVEIESGKQCDRPVLREALAFARRSKALFVIAKLDRLARNVAFVANLMETSVQFAACDLPGANNMTIHVMSAVAEAEAKAISERTTVALAEARKRGTLLGSHRPGSRPLSAEARSKGQAHSAQVNRAKAISEYSDLLPKMRALRKQGMSLRVIARRLTAEGHTTRNRREWTAVQVKRVLDRAASLDGT